MIKVVYFHFLYKQEKRGIIIKLYRSLSLIFVIIIIAFFSTIVFWKNININSPKNNESIYHSSTMNIEVVEKFKKEGEVIKYFLKSKNINEPFQDFLIEVKDENIWNLVDINEHYFVNVSWETDTNDINIQDKTTLLLQIDKL